MALLRKIPNSYRYPHGLEWRILKNMPMSFLTSGIFIGLFTLVAHLVPPPGTPWEVQKYLDLIDILAIATLVTVWLVLLTVAIGAFIVYLMKGPAYVWDPVDVIDLDEPKI